jgi:glutamine synthetase
MTDSFSLARQAAETGTRFILALFVDLTGKPCAKLVPVEAVEALATDGVGFAGYAVTGTGQASDHSMVHATATLAGDDGATDGDTDGDTDRE